MNGLQRYMADPKEFEMGGKKLVCPVCDNDKFRCSSFMLNTRGLTFLDLDWINEDADNYVCSKCGYIFWFMQQ
jgi:hypothetical protein